MPTPAGEADQLRQALVAGRVLPPRDEELARTGQWLAGILAAAEPAAARRLVQVTPPGT